MLIQLYKDEEKGKKKKIKGKTDSEWSYQKNIELPDTCKNMKYTKIAKIFDACLPCQN